jgi:hypothetical protein
MAQKITINELRSLVKQVISENEQEESLKAKEYVADMIEKYKDYKTVRKNILSNLVNSEYGRTSNSFVDKVWKELGKQFPS